MPQSYQIFKFFGIRDRIPGQSRFLRGRLHADAHWEYFAFVIKPDDASRSAWDNSALRSYPLSKTNPSLIS